MYEAIILKDEDNSIIGKTQITGLKKEGTSYKGTGSILWRNFQRWIKRSAIIFGVGRLHCKAVYKYIYLKVVAVINFFENSILQI